MQPRSDGYQSGGVLRDVGLPALAFVGALMVPFMWIFWAYVIGGQAHFFMAYRYQLKGKRMTMRYLAVAFLLILLTIGYFAIGAPLTPLLLVAGILFAGHFAYDEFTLHGEAHTRAAWTTVIGFTSLFAVLVVGIVLEQSFTLGYLAVITLYALVRGLGMHSRVTVTERYLWLVGVALVFLALLGLPYQILGVIILLHVVNWFIGYGTRLASRPERARAYWKEVGMMLGATLLLCIAYVQFEWQLLAILFSATGYYLWAVAHIVLSIVASLSKRQSV